MSDVSIAYCYLLFININFVENIIITKIILKYKCFTYLQCTKGTYVDFVYVKDYTNMSEVFPAPAIGIGDIGGCLKRHFSRGGKFRQNQKSRNVCSC